MKQTEANRRIAVNRGYFMIRNIMEIIQRLMSLYGTNCPFKLAKRLNISVWYGDPGDGTKGYYYRKLGRSFICINQNLTYEEQRQVCAHELGHHFLHRGLSLYFMDKHTLFKPAKFEREANCFAVHLLIGNNTIEYGESLENFLFRCGIPKAMHIFY